VCQTCILDLEYGLPVQVRDAALQTTELMPRTDVNKEYFAQNAEKMMSENEGLFDYSKTSQAGHELLKKIARTHPYYDRNRPHVCSFFVKGLCKRGDECPYRHEMPPEESELSKQNIKDRFHGTNDPVAKKILGRADNIKNIQAPDDHTITSLFITGVEASIKEHDLRDFFYAYGEIKSIVVNSTNKTAFINYTSRESAELAISKAIGGINIKGTFLKAKWGKPQAQGPKSDFMAPPPPPPAGTEGIIFGNIPPPPGSNLSSATPYPSQDPRQKGANVFQTQTNNKS